MKIIVLLSTYNGEKFLEEQLRSIILQRNVNLEIIVRDDGSKDSTCKILQKWQNKGFLRWYSGANLGPARSFMHLLMQSPDADYYAFCDQDDIWLPEKLSIALDKIKDHGNEAAIYISNLCLVDQNQKIIGYTSKERFSLTLAESLIYNPATGCTMVINRKMRDVLSLYEPSTMVMHDSWIYKVAISIGGFVYCDSQSHIYYRQHGDNLVGARSTWLKRCENRLKNIFGISDFPRYQEFIELLIGYKDLITAENKELLENIAGYKNSYRCKWFLIKCISSCAKGKISKIIFYINIILNKY